MADTATRASTSGSPVRVDPLTGKEYPPDRVYPPNEGPLFGGGFPSTKDPRTGKDYPTTLDPHRLGVSGVYTVLPVPDPRLLVGHPEYDSRYDITSPDYDPKAPFRAPYDARLNPHHPDYDPKYDPQSAKYDPKAPAREPYDARADPTSLLYDPRFDPDSDEYDPKTKPEKKPAPKDVEGAEQQFKVERDFEWSDANYTVRGNKGQTISGAGAATMHKALGDESPLKPAGSESGKKEKAKE